MDCSPPYSSVHRILQARILDWIAMPTSRGPLRPRVWRAWSKSGVGKAPKPPLWPNLWTHPYPHSIKGTSSPAPQGASKGTYCLFSLPSAAAGTPSKVSSPESFVWPLSISTDWGRPRTLVGNDHRACWDLLWHLWAALQGCTIKPAARRPRGPFSRRMPFQRGCTYFSDLQWWLP